MNTRRPQGRRGLFVAEVISAIMLVSVMAIILVVAVGRGRKASARLADSRAAVNLAERTLVAMQAGAALPDAPSGATVAVEKLDPVAGADGLVWANVKAQVNGRSATLMGVVKTSALAKQAGGSS